MLLSMVFEESFFSALDNAGKDPEALKERIKMLTHHVCDEHEWDGGQCDFHKHIVCSCGECKGDEITCAGKRYKPGYYLTAHRSNTTAQ